MVIPSDHISVAKVYFSWRRICGLMNWTVPEKEVVYWSLLWLLMILATPKSEILMPSSWINMFLGFISRWIILLSCKSYSPKMMHAIKNSMLNGYYLIVFNWRHGFQHGTEDHLLTSNPILNREYLDLERQNAYWLWKEK